MLLAAQAPHSSEDTYDVHPLFEPNHFSCPLVHTIRIPLVQGLELRLRADAKKDRKMGALQWLRTNALRHFAVYEQRNLFVYKSNVTGCVYYMSCFKHRCAQEGRTCFCVFDAS